MSPGPIARVPLKGRAPVTVVILTLADGRTVARTAEELDTLPPEEAEAVRAALAAGAGPDGGR